MEGIHMILAVDVSYRGKEAIVAGVLFHDWADDEPIQQYLISCQVPANYMPGQFFRRELPCIGELLKQVNTKLNCIVIDGYVHLGRERAPGLGKHLFDMLEQRIVVIGVAKSPFENTPKSCEVLRGKSRKPLYITTAGIKQERAKMLIQNMHGTDRIPTLLKHADKLCKIKTNAQG
jgi:deoxyribonuclease V